MFVKCLPGVLRVDGGRAAGDGEEAEEGDQQDDDVPHAQVALFEGHSEALLDVADVEDVGAGRRLALLRAVNKYPNSCSTSLLLYVPVHASCRPRP